MLSELDQLTAPVFIDVCLSYGCCCGEFCDTTAGELVSAEGPATSAVTVWSSGQVGDLDYVVLSASAGEGMAAWASANGFALGDEAAAVIAHLDATDTFFFLARVSPDADPARALPPFKLRFAPDTPPFYPLRFTGSLIPAGGQLDVLLWVVGPEDVAYEPAGQVETMDFFYDTCSEWGSSMTPVTYDSRVEKWLGQQSEGGFVREYDALLKRAPAWLGEVCVVGSTYTCASVPSAVPETRDAKLMVSSGFHALRLRGTLRGASLASDLRFTQTRREPTYSDEGRGVYCNVQECGGTCNCPPRDTTVAEDEPAPTGGCGAAPDASTAPPLLVLVTLLGLITWSIGQRRARSS